MNNCKNLNKLDATFTDTPPSPTDAMPSLHMDTISCTSKWLTCNSETGTHFSRWDLISVINCWSSSEYNIPYYHLIADKSD